jgi:hypothetical protein
MSQKTTTNSQIMKSIFSFIFIFTAWSAFAKAGDLKESRIFRQVIVNSDIEDLSIAKGKCLITGKVFYEVEMDPYSTDFILATELVQFIYDVDGKKIGSTNALGEFEVLVNESTKYLLFTKKQDKDSLYEKIYFENHAFTSQHKINISVYIPLKYSGRNIMVDKPVIYAYSENPIDFTLKVIPQGVLTFTYPQLPTDNTWKMKTDENGNLTASNGANYPYLFWESNQNASVLRGKKSNSNEIVAQRDLIPFLEKNLSNLGLNSKETTDFITYWAPKLQKFKMIQVEFFVDEKCEVIGELEINPKPDHLRRVYAIFNELSVVSNQFVNKPLDVKPLRRNGFTIIEWGGSIINEKIIRNAD